MTGRRIAGAALVAAIAVGGVTGCDGSGAAQLSRSQVRTFLDQHAAAVQHHDRAEFTSGLDTSPAARSFRRAQVRQFDNLRHVPLRVWRYTPAAQVNDAQAQAAARRRFGSSALVVKVTLHYALTGVDPQPSTENLWWTLARVDGHVVICADNALALVGGVSWRGPWDFGTLAVVRGTHSLVLGPADARGQLTTLAADVDRAVPAVRAVWGGGWPEVVEVVVPSGTAATAAALGSSTDTGTASSGIAADIAAVAVSDAIDPVSGRPLGERVVIQPSGFDRLTTLGQRIVLTHEITHVASAAATGGASPRWLVEGLADYVANLHTGQPVRTVAAELVAQLRRSGVPRALPSDDDFDSATTAAAAYEQGWLACRLIAQRVGAAGLVRIYRLVGESGMSERTAVAGALRSVLHESTASFTAQWRSYLSHELG